jgi:hypothetical protein
MKFLFYGMRKLRGILGMEFLGMLIPEHLLGQSNDVVPRTLLGSTRVESDMSVAGAPLP